MPKENEVIEAEPTVATMVRVRMGVLVNVLAITPRDPKKLYGRGPIEYGLAFVAYETMGYPDVADAMFRGWLVGEYMQPVVGEFHNFIGITARNGRAKVRLVAKYIDETTAIERMLDAT